MICWIGDGALVGVGGQRIEAGAPQAGGDLVLPALQGLVHEGGVGELLGELQPQGAVAPFDEAGLLQAARALLAHPPAPGTMQPAYQLQAMQEATLALYRSLADA